MARKKSGGEWSGWAWLIGISLGAIALYYLEAGRGSENDAALLPNRLEDRIDFLVTAINKRFGKQWGNRALDVIQASLEKILPADAVALVSVIYGVEQLSKRIPMTSDDKKQRAIQTICWS